MVSRSQPITEDNHMADRCSPGSARDLAEELREYTAMKYAGDCKCGKCQLVPRTLVERIYHTLNSTPGGAATPSEPIEQLRAALADIDISAYNAAKWRIEKAIALLNEAQTVTPMQADIAQIISDGWSNGKTSTEVAEAVLREFDTPAQGSRDLIYDAVLKELETKHRMPTSVTLAIKITDAVLALSSTTREAPIGGTESCTCHFFGAGTHHVPGCPYYTVVTSLTSPDIQS